MMLLFRAVRSRVLGLVAAVWSLTLGVAGEVHADPPVGTVTVTVNQPTVGFRAAGTLLIRASMSSTYEIMNVHAVVGTVELDLTPPVPPSIEWTGDLPVTSLPHGNQTLVVTATDPFGASGQASRVFFRDEAPILRWNLPEYPTASRGPVTVEVTCEDDDPGGCIEVRLEMKNGGLLAWSTTGSLSYTFDNESYAWPIKARGWDASRTTTITTTIYLEQGDELEEVARAAGAVFDYDGARLLYRALPSQRARLMDGSFDSDLGDAQAHSVAAYDPVRGQLTTGGAAWSSVQAPGGGPLPNCSTTRNEQVYSSQSGVTTLLASCRGFRAAGDYAFFGTTNSIDSVFDVIHLPTGVTTESVADVNAMRGVVGDNGDVFLKKSTDAHSNVCYVDWIRAGVPENIGTVPCAAGSIVTDGKSVALSGEATSSPALPLVLLTPGEEPVSIEGGNPSEIQLADGWLAYTKLGTSARQVWVRSPEGVSTQLSYFGTRSWLEAVGGEGEVMFLNSDARYYAAPGVAPFRVSYKEGRPYYSCGAWFIALGDTVLHVLGTVDSESEGCHASSGGGGTGGASGTGGDTSSGGDTGSGGAVGGGGEPGSGGDTGSGGDGSPGGSGSGGTREPASGGNSSAGGTSTGGSSSTGGTSSGMGGDNADDSGSDGEEDGGGCSVSSSGGHFDLSWIGAFTLLALTRRRARFESRKAAA